MAAPAPVVRDCPATLAQLRWLAAHEPGLFPCLLDGPEAGPLARHALLLARGQGELLLDGAGRLEAHGAGLRALPGGFLASLDAACRDYPARPLPAGLPFAGGWLLYLAYEFASQVEPRLRLPPQARGLPLAWAARVGAAIVLELATGRCQVVTEPGSTPAAEALEAALARSARALAAAGMREPGAAAAARQGPLPLPMAVSEEDPGAFLAAVEAAQRSIAAGDTYQANLSRAWRVDYAEAPDAGVLYEALARSNPAPFAALAHLPGGAVLLSSSPERLVRVRGRRIDARPIAGTRPRSGPEDLPERAALLAHPKERAEHVMLIDLERNDLGRVCEPGSVEVEEFMVTETYRHVHHIVSNVAGRLRPEASAGDVLRAVFPGGTITGCPKLRSIEVIAALEGAPRGPYTGSLGYLGDDGSMDMNILIRTACLRGRTLEWRAGAGIVADSEPARELAETRAKALGLLRAFGALPAAEGTT